jgi:demethylmenaquinone methyltransferase/2-methoxy-6-polyprenyl-1,4-benzoquinol methylase
MSGEAPVDRVHRSKDAARATYDSLSRFYDLLSGGFERRSRERGLDLLAARDGERALEVGFGTGHGVLSLARAVGPSGTVRGIDISARMRDIAAARLARCGLADRAELVVGDASVLPWGGGSVDAIFMSYFLELLDTPEIPPFLAECARVLAPGGRICAVGMSAEGEGGFVSSCYRIAHRHFERFVDCRPIEVERSLVEAGFAVEAKELQRMCGLPVEVVLSRKGGS